MLITIGTTSRQSVVNSASAYLTEKNLLAVPYVEDLLVGTLTMD